ncbi:cadherin-like beta sandwich domain-containing protein [Methanolobus mangrovi]|uniref:Cadherin-like beta sandwich domain-containing protein n=1 Tax=Methanolobus mangrovi TaxID=3072977 RepID=A0AA51UFL7_9EURY|nr:cadherin-like beta sandwich domain-containing protein [Methanolobus mangrovi]WMW22296.1 cadherin-like beta sandwich domain-containing protein [Methanolobus mangrovi]
MSALLIVPSGCLDTDTSDQANNDSLSDNPDDSSSNLLDPTVDDDTSVNPTADGTTDSTSTEESSVQTVTSYYSSGGSSSSSSSSTSSDVSRTVTSGDYTEPVSTITGDLTITGATTGTITLPSGLIINGDLIVNTPSATVYNYATVGGTVDIQAVSVHTWNQYGDAGSIIMSATNATFNFFSGNVSGEVDISAENATFEFIAGNITGGVNLTQPSTVIINATATDLPEITVEEGAEGSDIDNLGNEELELIAEANVTVAGTVNVTGVIPTERTARGSLSLSDTSAIYNTNVNMIINYTAGEDLSNGVVNITVPVGFAVADTNGLTIAGAGTTVADNDNASYNVNILTVENVTINKDEIIALTLTTQSVSSAGNYDFSATAKNTSKLTSNAATARFTSLLNNDADLSDLVVSTGTLVPGFDVSTTNYTVNVTYDVSSIDVTATLSDTNASMLVNGDTTITGSAKSVTLQAAGETTSITVAVTAEDGTTTKTYTVTVDRAVDTTVVDNADIATAKSTLETAATLNPVEGTDTNATVMAQTIVDGAVSGVTVTISDANGNANVAADGTISYTASEITGNVVFALNKGTGTQDTATMSVVVPANPTAAANADIATAKSTLETAATLNPVEGTDTNATVMAQTIVDGAVSGVTVTISDANGNANVAADGTISYTASEITGNVVFALNKGTGTQDTATMSVVVPANPTAAANADIATAKAALETAATLNPVEGTDTNATVMAQTIVDGAVSGVTVTISDASGNANVAADGTISYTASEITGNVVFALNKGTGTQDTATMSVVVPANPTAAANADIATAKAALETAATLNPVEGTDTNATVMAQTIVDGAVSGVTVTISDASGNANVAADGTISYTASEITGNVVFALNKGTGTQDTATMSVVVPANPTAAANADIATAKAALETAATLNPVEGTDTNATVMAQTIVDGAVSGVTVTISDASGNANVAADGTISYTASEITGNVVFALNKGTGTQDTATMSVVVPANPTAAANADIATAKAALETAATLNPVEGTDTNATVMAQTIVDGAVSGVTVTISDANGNANVAADGTISYTASEITGNVVFALNKGTGTQDTATMSVVVPANPTAAANADIATAKAALETAATLNPVEGTDTNATVMAQTIVDGAVSGVTVTISDASGNANVAADGTISYTASEITGNVVFALNKGTGTQDTATMSVVVPANPTAAANADIATAKAALETAATLNPVEGTDTNATVMAQTIVDGAVSGVTVTISDASGNANVAADGTISYTASEITGNVVFALNKGTGTQDTATMSVVVPANPTAAANADIATAKAALETAATLNPVEGTDTNATVMAQTIVDGAVSGVTVTISDASGNANVAADGTISYTASEITGNVVFALNKGTGTQDTATMSVVVPANPTAAANADIATAKAALETAATLNPVEGTDTNATVMAQTIVDGAVSGVTVTISDANGNANVAADGTISYTASEITGNVVFALNKGTGTQDTATMSVVVPANPTAAANADIATAKAALETAATLNPVEGTDTNATVMAQTIVDGAVSGVTVTISDASGNANVAADGTISYTASEITGNVVFALNKGTGTQDTATMSVVVPANPTAAANADIATAKAALETAATLNPVEGTDTNATVMAQTIVDGAVSGVTVTISDASGNANVAADGTISYTASEITGNVVFALNKGTGTQDTATMSVVVPANPTAAANADIATAKAALETAATLNPVEGTDTNATVMAQTIVDGAVSGVTVTISDASGNANVAADGTISYTASEITGNVVFALNKGTGTQDTATMSVVVPANPTAAANADIATAKAALETAATLNPVEGTDTNATVMAQTIVDGAVSGVTVTISDASGNANVAADGTISYTASEITGNVVFALNKGTGTQDTATMSVVVPATTG